MLTVLRTLTDKLESPAASGTDVIRWASPVPSFGDLSTSRVATLGLNPSNREFEDKSGELQDPSRRFPTLGSLGLDSWKDAGDRHLRLILDSCREYFLRNPYNTWFRPLDKVISGVSASFYGESRSACHLDLIPYATARKWTELRADQKSSLLAIAGDTLGLLLRDSPVRILILNGMSVVKQFQKVAEIRLEQHEMPTWSLSRRLEPVTGLAYTGVVNALSGFRLRDDIQVLGYNHNLQSTFGMSDEVIFAIRDWIAQMGSA